MGSAVTTLVAAIKTRTATVLGSSYKELSYSQDLAKNSFKGANNRYGVLPLGFAEDDGIGRLGHITTTQTFQVVLTNGYRQSHGSDATKIAAVIALQDLTIDLYKDYINTKVGAPTIVVIAKELIVEDPEYLEDDSIVAVRMNFSITYRRTI